MNIKAIPKLGTRGVSKGQDCSVQSTSKQTTRHTASVPSGTQIYRSQKTIVTLPLQLQEPQVTKQGLATDARRALSILARELNLTDGHRLHINRVSGSTRNGYEIVFNSEQRAYALPVDGQDWFFSPVKITKQQLHPLQRAARDYFKEPLVLDELRSDNLSTEQIDLLRDKVRPLRARWPHELNSFPASKNNLEVEFWQPLRQSAFTYRFEAALNLKSGAVEMSHDY